MSAAFAQPIINERLWIEHGEGAARAHRVTPAGPCRLAVLDGRRCRAMPVNRIGEHGTVLVPVGDLALAAPLGPDDERTYARLDAALAGTIGDSRILQAFNALRLRALTYGSTGGEQ